VAKSPVRLSIMDYFNIVLLALKNTLAEKAGIIEVEKKSLFQVIIEFITEIEEFFDIELSIEEVSFIKDLQSAFEIVLIRT
jgi:hypothetical protein